MAGLWIFLSIVSFFVLLLSLSLCVKVSITDDVRIKVGLLGIYRDVLSPEKDLRDERKEEKKKLKKKRKKKKKPAAEKKRTSKKKKPVKEFSKTVHYVLDIIKMIFDPVKFVLRHVRLVGIKVLISVGCKEADKTPLAFVGTDTAVKNTLGILASQIVVKIKRVDIRPDFDVPELRQDISFKAKLRNGIIIAGFLGMLYNIIKKSFKSQRGSEQGNPPAAAAAKDLNSKEGVAK